MSYSPFQVPDTLPDGIRVEVVGGDHPYTIKVIVPEYLVCWQRKPHFPPVVEAAIVSALNNHYHITTFEDRPKKEVIIQVRDPNAPAVPQVLPRMDLPPKVPVRKARHLPTKRRMAKHAQ